MYFLNKIYYYKVRLYSYILIYHSQSYKNIL